MISRRNREKQKAARERRQLERELKRGRRRVARQKLIKFVLVVLAGIIIMIGAVLFGAWLAM